MKGRVLVVAGSDSGAGAGIQADLKTVGALGGYATTVVTALTAQNTLGVQGVFPIPADFVRRQFVSVFEDIGADCIKTGMLHDSSIVALVAELLEKVPAELPLVLDPVLLATDGTRLLDADAVEILIRRLIPRATVLTPNLPEASYLTGLAIGDIAGMQRAAARLVEMGARTVLLKGGHLAGPIVADVFCGPAGMIVLESPRLETRHTHGTGCTLASAIATGLAQGMDPLAATQRARAYLIESLRRAPGLGQGHGPLGHLGAIEGVPDSRT